MSFLRTAASAPVVRSSRTPAPGPATRFLRTRASVPAERIGHTRASARATYSGFDRAFVPAEPFRPARVSVPTAGPGRAPDQVVRARHSRASARSLWSRRTAASAPAVRSWASAPVGRSNGPRVDASPGRLSPGGPPAMRVRHISAAEPGRRPCDGAAAEPVLSARVAAHAVCFPEVSVSIADARFPEPAPAACSAGSVATTGTGGWRAALGRGTPIARHSYPSNVLRATRGPEVDRPSRTPVKSILRGFVTHRACRLSARPCILNGIDAPSPDGRNRSTTRGVEV
jgi:hypothetical protein